MATNSEEIHMKWDSLASGHDDSTAKFIANGPLTWFTEVMLLFLYERGGELASA